MPSLRLTQRYQTTTSLLSPAIRLSLCSHKVSSCLVRTRVGEVVFGRRWLSRTTTRTSSFNAQCRPTIFTSRTSSTTAGGSGQVVDEMLALERDTFQRCLPAQPAPSALQRFSRRKCAFLLGDLAATADLPPHSAHFSQQLLDLTHRWWTEREDPDIDITDVHPLAAAVYSHIMLRSARYPDPARFQLPDTPLEARSLTDLLAAVAALLAGRQPHNAPLLHSARTVH